MILSNFAVIFILIARGDTSPLFYWIIKKLKDIINHISELVKSYLPDDSYFIVDVKISGKKNHEKVTILIDGDHGVNIAVCSSISRQLSDDLDNLNFSESNYTLEVSSPGTDFPLSSERQFRKNLGRNLKVVLKNENQIKGELLEISEQGILVRRDKFNEKVKEDIFIPYEDIKRTNVLVSFK